jgi:hypothetical protein
MNLKLAMGVVAMAAMSLMASPAIIHAQDNASDSTQMVTGCLQKGSNANTFTLIDENGKLWTLRSKTVQLGPHVGHTVTISGTIPQKSKDENKAAGDTSPQNRLRVTNLKMVSDSCQQNK